MIPYFYGIGELLASKIKDVSKTRLMWLINKKKYKDLDDRQLIVDYRNTGDKKAIGVLFERYSHLVYGVCMKYLKNEDDCKDATISIFEKVIEDLKRFDVEKFGFWIHTVARNYCLMQLRNRKAMLYVDDENGPGTDILVESSQTLHQSDEQKMEQQLQLLEEAMLQLNDAQQTCVDLFYLKKYCYQDVAQITGYSMHEVKSHIQNGKRNLKIYMMKKSHERSIE